MKAFLVGTLIVAGAVVALAAAEGDDPDVAARVAALIETLPGEDMGSRVRAKKSYEELCEIGAPAVPGLIETLKHEDPYARLWAAAALGRIRDPRAKAPLLDYLQNEKHVDGRRVGVYHIRHWLDDPEVSRVVTRLMDDPNGGVREWARRAMMETRRGRFLDFMDKKLRDADPAVRGEALEYLSHLREPKPRLKTMFLERLEKDDEPHIRRRALEWLEAYESEEEYTRLLIERAEHDREAVVRGVAVDRLEDRLAPGVYDKIVLGRLENDPDVKVRALALKSLLDRGDLADRIVPILIDWIDKPPAEWSGEDRERIRRTADKALSHFTGEPFKGSPPPPDESPEAMAKRWREWRRKNL